MTGLSSAPGRPLIITDCDEVLLHFAEPFGAYLAAHHDLELKFESFALVGNIRHRSTGEAIGQEGLAPLFAGFFGDDAEGQPAVSGAVEALAALSAIADIVVLTNIPEYGATRRGAVLADLGMPYPVVANDGPKGPAVARILAERGVTRAVFIDDLPPHHSSVKRHAPHVHRLLMIADPTLRRLAPPAPDADAHIDDWGEARAHIERLFAASDDG